MKRKREKTPLKQRSAEFMSPSPLRPRATSTPVKERNPRSKVNLNFQSEPKVSVGEKIVKSVAKSKYETAFRHILARGRSAQEAFDSVVRKRVTRQVKTYAKQKGNYPIFDGKSSVENFSWDQIDSEVKEHLPTFHAALVGSFPAKKRKMTEKQEDKFT